MCKCVNEKVVYLCIYVLVQVRYTHTCVYACMYIRMCVYMCVGLRVCMRICVYMCRNVGIFPFSSNDCLVIQPIEERKRHSSCGGIGGLI